MTPETALLLTPGGAASLTTRAGGRVDAVSPAAQARREAEAFEAVLVNTMLQHMFTGVGEEGPLGNSAGMGVWRSFLTEEYAKDFVKAGGIGLADHVYQTLLAGQEARTDTPVTEGRRL